MYELKFSKQVVKVLRKLPKNVKQHIEQKLQQLAKNPFDMAHVKALTNLNAYRLRVGDWRIIYTVEEACLEIWIIKLASRGEVYKS